MYNSRPRRHLGAFGIAGWLTAGIAVLILVLALTGVIGGNSSAPGNVTVMSSSAVQPRFTGSMEDWSDAADYQREMGHYQASYFCPAGINDKVDRLSKLTPCPTYIATVVFNGNGKANTPTLHEALDVHGTRAIRLVAMWDAGCGRNDQGQPFCDPHWTVTWRFGVWVQPFGYDRQKDSVWVGLQHDEYYASVVSIPPFDSRFDTAGEVYASATPVTTPGTPLNRDRGHIPSIAG